MDCKKVREWLMTDYLDRALESQRSDEVERHLHGCSACREFLETVKKVAVQPFKNTQALEPDPAVWQRIQERIQAEAERQSGWFGKLADALTPLWRIPQPAFRVAFVALLIGGVVLVASWPSAYVDPAYAYIEEQAAFMDELEAGDPEVFNGDFNDYETVFETALE